MDSIRIPEIYTISDSHSYDLDAASGFHAVIFGLVLTRRIRLSPQIGRLVMLAHVEYVLNAARLAVGFGWSSGNSHFRAPVCRMGSSVGGLSTMYDIQACHPGSICDL